MVFIQLSFCITKDTKLQNFQFKIWHRILPVNSFLYKCGLTETELCIFLYGNKGKFVTFILEM